MSKIKPSQPSSDLPTARRLYVGGLTSSIAQKDLSDRFGMFGTVQEVETVGVDGLGQPRNFAYLTLSTTAQNMKRCLNIMQGSTWRGAKLKIATAKPKYTDKLAAERQAALPTPSSSSSTSIRLPDKEHRKQKLAERREKKRRLKDKELDGRQCGDMRVVTMDNWEEEGRKRQHWQLSSSHHLVRPVLTRPSHPLVKPLGSAPSSSFDKDKKQSKARRNPPTRSKRVWLDPSKYSTHLNEDALFHPGADTAPAGDEWAWESDEDEEGAGKWVKVSGKREVVVVPGKRKRVEGVLEELARTSVWADTIQDVRERNVPKKRKVERPLVEDVVVSLGDDDIWGSGVAQSTREGSPLFAPRAQDVSAGLFDSPPLAPKATATLSAGLFDPSSPLPLPLDDLPAASESAGLFDSPVVAPAAIEDLPPAEEESAGLFDSSSERASPVDPGSNYVDSDISSSEDEDEEDDEVSLHEEQYESVAEFAAAERNKGLEALRRLGMSTAVDEEEDVEVGRGGAVEVVEASSDHSSSSESTSDSESEDGELTCQPIDLELPSEAEMRVNLRTSRAVVGDEAPSNSGEASDMGDKKGKKSEHSGSAQGGNGKGKEAGQQGGDEKEDEDVDMDGGAAGGDGGDDSDGSDSSDDDEEDSSSDSDSDSDDEEDEDEEVKKKAETENGPSEAPRARHSLRDMFAPKEEGATGFSLMGHLDLDLESDFDEDVLVSAPIASSSTQPVEPVAFAPVQAVPGATFNGAMPMFFGFEAPEGTQPFVRTETDAEMAASWNAEKLSMTRDYKKRHRDAVKKVKRGFGVASGGNEE